MSRDVVIGVKLIDDIGALAITPEEAEVAINCSWVKVGDAVLWTDEHGIVSVETLAHNGPYEITIKLYASSFRTADANGPDRPPHKGVDA